MSHSPTPDRVAINRRRFIQYFSSVGLGATLLPGTLVAVTQDAEEVTVEMLASAEKLAGLSFSERDRKRFVNELKRLKQNYENNRKIDLDQDVPPCFVFNPIPPGTKPVTHVRKPAQVTDIDVSLPGTEREIAYLPVTHLSKLIRTRKLTSAKLTQIYLRRLKEHNEVLKCAITITEDLALRQANKADEEIASGNYRGPLHGIPWGAKDIISVRGYKTTWGAETHKDQVIDMDATVYKRLTEAGAVLVAKLTTGALAGGNAWWFGGETKNPWNLKQGASGSSAGSGSATAAGLVGFSLGTETQGSIIGPSRRCGVSGLRPTFGLVSRHGVMPLSWTMDKVGPMCRSAEDCALVLSEMWGVDGYDMSLQESASFNWNPEMDAKKIRVGYLKSAFERKARAGSASRVRLLENRKKLDQTALETFRTIGIELVPLELPASISSRNLGFVLHTEGAAMFDDIVRDGSVDKIKNSTRPRLFRVRRYVPGVEYVQANRVRTKLMYDLGEALKDVDVYLAPAGSTGLTNHTGHPAMTIPHGFVNGSPVGLSIIGNLFKDAEILAVARAFQNATDHHLRYPKF